MRVRTDAGVHAKQIVLLILILINLLHIKKVILKMNGFLNNDIAINNIYSVADDTHCTF